MGGLFGGGGGGGAGGKGYVAPPSQNIGVPAPPPPPLFLRLCLYHLANTIVATILEQSSLNMHNMFVGK